MLSKHTDAGGALVSFAKWLVISLEQHFGKRRSQSRTVHRIISEGEEADDFVKRGGPAGRLR